MNPETSPGQEIYIQRHCMQNLLHEALISDPKPCSGLLAGGGNMIDTAIPVTNFVNIGNVDMPHPMLAGHPLTGIYLSVHPGQQPDRIQIEKLAKFCESQYGIAPHYCLILDLGQHGRIDATLYSDLALTKTRSLEMLEDSGLYPVSANR
ncbi:hypothetical protein Ga0123462_0311 [Mariprofundus ferrinatatus]|uniref:Uncharacterized protein n=1 Tax=Mariprofundus ferrinatatus TaxID=1921087 RepID=A0A2K8LA85_9PROT|nr:hypothetical protein [Mariprofundus ferrinatatus]ATX81186.1 hypothetical protein Ga0123462_0311 [Mariprofundus ferrinatatus]